MSPVTTPGASNADSYADVATAVAYALAKGLTFPGTDQTLSEQALRRATAWIDFRYRNAFMGQKWQLRAQALEWPRVGVVDRSGFSVTFNTVPIEVVNATCEAAIREFAEPNSLAPDLDRGGSIKELQAGSVRLVYGASASAQTTFQVIDGILSALLGVAPQYTATAVRGG